MERAELNSDSKPTETVTILMATYNGAPFIEEQLESIARQSHPHWQLIISDDGSTDRTLPIVCNFARLHSDKVITIKSGPRAGFAANFMSMLEYVDFGPIAFCDQDDIWMDDHLETSLSSLPRNVPAATCGSTQLIDRHHQFIGMSPPLQRPLGFRNALLQNICSGNTLVINNEGLALLKSLPRTCHKNIVSHDWWIYQVFSGTGAKIQYLEIPSVQYRQHDSNTIGSNKSRGATLKRLARLTSGEYRSWIDSNIQSLDPIKERLTPQNQEVLREFCHLRNQCSFVRARLWNRLRLYHQTRKGDLVLRIANFLRLI